MHSIEVTLYSWVQPGILARPVKEGLEPPIFWSSLGGKRKYPSQREPKDAPKDPRLYACSLMKGKAFHELCALKVRQKHLHLYMMLCNECNKPVLKHYFNSPLHCGIVINFINRQVSAVDSHKNLEVIS
jgi:hypothetical protein